MPRIDFSDFSGGLWIPAEATPINEQAGFAIPQNGLLQADNLDFLPSGAIRGRRGSAKANAGAAAPGEIRVIHRYLVRDQTQTAGSAQGVAVGATDQSATGTVAWDNPNAATVQDSIFAFFEASGVGTVSHYLARHMRLPEASQTIPANATVLGIQLDARMFLVAGSVRDVSIRLYDPNNVGGLGAGFVGTEQATSTTKSTIFTFFNIQVGGPIDDWGLGAALAPPFVNDPDWGIGLSFDTQGGGLNRVGVDSIQISVYYTAPTVAKTIVGHLNGANLEYEDLVGGAFVAITGGTVVAPILPDARPKIVNWPEKFKSFIFDGANAPRQLQIDSAGTLEIVEIPTNGSVPAPEGPFVTLHKNRLFATRQGEIGFTVEASEILQEDVWAGRQISVNDPNAGKITGLESFGDSVIILKDTGLWNFSGDIEFSPRLVQYETTEGCVAPDTVRVTPRGVIYLARSGLRITDGFQSVPLSDQIKPLFRERDLETQYPDAVGVWFPRRQQYWLKLDPTNETVGYVLHFVDIPGRGLVQAWSRITILPMNCGTVFQTSGDDGDLILGDKDGFVWTRDVGNLDEASVYLFEIVTQQRLLSPQLNLGRVYQLKALYRGTTAIGAGVRYDQTSIDDVGVTLGVVPSSASFQEPRGYIGDKTKFGRFASLHVLAAGNAEIEIHRIDMEYQLRGQRRWP